MIGQEQAMGINLTNWKSSIIVALAGSAIFSLMVVFATRSEAPKASASERRFDDAWVDVIQIVPLKKTDRIVSADPKHITVERVLPLDTPVSVPPIVLSVGDNDPPSRAKRRRHVELDVCQRHGMHKVTRGRSWHCKR